MKKGYYQSWLVKVEDELEKAGIDIADQNPAKLRQLFSAGILPDEVPHELTPEPGSDDFEVTFDEEPYEHPSAREASSGRSFECFDKFMDDIVIRESRQPTLKTVNDSAQRKVATRYQDRPSNKIRIVRK